MRILFVCTGNICRSPIAEGILRSKLSEAGLDTVVDSCGFESFHVGDHPDPRAVKVTRRRGIDISGHVSRLFTRRDFDLSDRIYVMDSSHYQELMRMAGSEQDMKKVDYLLNLLYPGQNLPVPDPWYSDIHAFERVYDLMEPACEKIVSGLLDNTARREH
jgi:protein-tyrosine phosphatase